MTVNMLVYFSIFCFFPEDNFEIYLKIFTKQTLSNKYLSEVCTLYCLEE